MVREKPPKKIIEKRNWLDTHGAGSEAWLALAGLEGLANLGGLLCQQVWKVWLGWRLWQVCHQNWQISEAGWSGLLTSLAGQAHWQHERTNQIC